MAILDYQEGSAPQSHSAIQRDEAATIYRIPVITEGKNTMETSHQQLKAPVWRWCIISTPNSFPKRNHMASPNHKGTKKYNPITRLVVV